MAEGEGKMEVIYLDDTTQLNDVTEHAMAIGFFDGVHLGHQKLFDAAKMYAKRKGIKSSALTFSPHPDEVLKGDKNRKYITPLQDKIDKIAACGIDKLFVMKFNRKFASLPPIDFIHRYIIGMNVKHVVVGFDFTFGFKAEGNTKLLEKLALQTRLFDVTIVPKETYLHTKIGSTETKKLVKQGKVDIVPHYLGEHYVVRAQTNHICYNILYVDVDKQYILPENGVYAVKIQTDQGTFYGELTIEPYSENELIIYELENPNVKAMEITFLNRLTVKNAVLV